MATKKLNNKIVSRIIKLNRLVREYGLTISEISRVSGWSRPIISKYIWGDISEDILFDIEKTVEIITKTKDGILPKDILERYKNCREILMNYKKGGGK